MKKLFSILLALSLCLALCFCACAESETPVLGGTKMWPEFRGMQFGLGSTAVIYHEADAGLPIVCQKNGGEAIDLSEAATARAYPVVTSEPVAIFGRDAYLRYEFNDGIFTLAALYWPMSSDEEALDWIDTVRAEAESVYGTPDKLALLTDDGETIPADPADDYYALFEDSIENYPDTVPFFNWNLGKAFTFSNDSPEAQEGQLSLYVKTVEAESLEAGIGMEADAPVVVLNVSRPFFAQAMDSSLFE